MASKTYDFAFKILGGLDPQFARSFQQATGQIKNHNRTLSELEQNLKAMEDAYRKGIISERSFTNNKSALINKINQETQAIEKLTQQQKEYQEAQNAISAGIERIHKPIKENVEIYEKLYKKYKELARFSEDLINNN